MSVGTNKPCNSVKMPRPAQIASRLLLFFLLWSVKLKNDERRTHRVLLSPLTPVSDSQQERDTALVGAGREMGPETTH